MRNLNRIRAAILVFVLILVVCALLTTTYKPEPVNAAISASKINQLLMYDCGAGVWRYIGKSEINGTTQIVEKAADYTIATSVKSGTVFIATTGAVNFTLPTPTGRAGCVFTFINGVNANMLVKTATADTLITDGDLTADSVAFSTSSHKIGGRCVLWCDGTNWYAFNASGCTMTVAT